MDDEAQQLRQIARALHEQFPELRAIAPLRLLDHGWRSSAVATAGGAVFRIGRNAAATAGYRKELRLLPFLRRKLPVPVPQPNWHAEPCQRFRFGAIGYPMLPGAPLRPEWLTPAHEARIAADLGAFLAALHRIDAAQAAAAGAPASSSGRAFAALATEMLPALRSVLTPREYAVVVDWWGALLADGTMHAYAPTLRHGDLWYGNVLIDERAGRVSGVLDWEEAAIGDPAQDFATQFHLGDRFAALVIDEYRAAGGIVDGDLPRRARKLWELRTFGGIAFSVRHDDPLELEESIAKLRAGPVLGAAG